MVPILGFTCFSQPFIKAPELLEEIHLCSTCDKDEFIEYVNELSSTQWVSQFKYERIPEIDIIFNNIEMPGLFKEVGHEVLNGNPYIKHDKINKIIKL